MEATSSSRHAPWSPVLVADADPAVLALASSALVRAGYVTITAQDAATCRTLAEAEPVPRVVIADWALHAADAAAFYQEVRGIPEVGYVYFIVLAAKGRKSDAVAAMEAGADEYIMKPFAPEELVARVGAAQRMLAAVRVTSQRLRPALEAAARSTSGEVVVRRDETVGRVFFHDGQVVWAHLSSRPLTVVSLFDGVAKLNPEEVHEVLDEAKRTGRNFVDLLVEWGLVSAEDAIATVRGWIRQTIRAMLFLDSPQVVFVPAKRGSWGGPKFLLAEVLPPESLRPPPPMEAAPVPLEQPKIRCQFVEECRVCATVAPQLLRHLEESGADGVAIVHRSSGSHLGRAGDPIDEDIIRAMLRILGVLANEDGADDVIVSSGGKHYLVRATSCPDAVIGMVASKQRVSLGAVRHAVGQIAGRIFPEEAATARRRARASRIPTPGEPPREH